MGILKPNKSHILTKILYLNSCYYFSINNTQKKENTSPMENSLFFIAIFHMKCRSEQIDLVLICAAFYTSSE